MKTLILNATIINEGTSQRGSVLIDNDLIARVDYEPTAPTAEADMVIDGEGYLLMPGVIDEHVHFREPGMTQKADIMTESRAAAAGGVTTYFDMPNCRPATTTLEAWKDKMDRAAETSAVNYSFFFGATNDNTELLAQLDRQHVCGIKLFMGSSTGNMLVDDEAALRRIFSESPLPIMAHCEDTDIINRNSADIRAKYGDNADVKYHPIIRSEEACVKSSALAIRLTSETGARLHIAHISTATELDMIAHAPENITGEVCLSHLLFCDEDYETLGTRIKCNPAVKTRTDRDALRHALAQPCKAAMTIGTDHAPHLPTDKEGGCLKAASGMPMVQFSLPAMMTMSDEGLLSRERVVELMCHAPARLFGVERRGFVRPGYFADLVLLHKESHTVNAGEILSRCGWSPLEGCTLGWRICTTWVNGNAVYNNGNINPDTRGRAVTFCR